MHDFGDDCCNHELHKWSNHKGRLGSAWMELTLTTHCSRVRISVNYDPGIVIKSYLNSDYGALNFFCYVLIFGQKYIFIQTILNCLH